MGVRDNGNHGVITGNYFHDFTEPLNQYWGPMGVVDTGSYTEIAHNRFDNYAASAPSGALTAAPWSSTITNTRKASGFTTTTAVETVDSLNAMNTAVTTMSSLRTTSSDDYEKFLGLNGARGWKVINNTVLRTRYDDHGFSDFIWFRNNYNPNKVWFTNNIFIARNADMSIYGYGDGKSQDTQNNLYWSFTGQVNVGKPLGEGDRVADPLFVDFDNRDLHLRAGSPGIDAGTAAGYSADLEGTTLVGGPDLGAYEFTGTARVEKLFNGSDLDNWTFYLTKQDGPVDPSDVWTLKDGVIRASGGSKGYIRTKNTYRNFRLIVEWRWPESPGDSGVLLRVYGAEKLWPISVEAQIAPERAGDLLGHGRELEGGKQQGDSSLLSRPGESVERAPGEWNRYEIVCKRQSIVVTVNGKELNRAKGQFPYEGHIGLQSEAGPIEFRRVELTRLD